jgi:carbon-monoxide dehydrogenase medium subunit
MWSEYINAGSISDALPILNEMKGQARIIAGATDLMLEMERGVRKGIKTLIDISRVPNLDEIRLDEKGWLHIGPMVTHNHVVGSAVLRAQAAPLAQACWQVGSPQIRNRGTVAGNMITGSPANDTITPLMALDAVVTLQSVSGKREVALRDFYLGVRKTVMRPDEMLVDISFPALKPNEKGAFEKYALRNAQAISVLNMAAVLRFEGDVVGDAKVTLGAVAPTIIHAEAAEEYLKGKRCSTDVIEEAARLAAQSARPIDDIRSSADYRCEMTQVICRRAFEAIAASTPAARVPDEPVLLWGKPEQKRSGFTPGKMSADSLIRCRINGRNFEFRNEPGKNLLSLIREQAKLTGTKEGCAEGECGACTVYLDGKAVMSCLVPAPRANHADIATVEGLAKGAELHPVQQAFIDQGAVQCGYCTPGFLMSAVKLLEEKPHPEVSEIKQAITGNLCRCTGYYKIVQAVEQASKG